MAKSPIGNLFASIHEKAPGLMIGLFEVGGSVFIITGGGLKTYIGILLLLAGGLDIHDGIRHHIDV